VGDPPRVSGACRSHRGFKSHHSSVRLSSALVGLISRGNSNPENERGQPPSADVGHQNNCSHFFANGGMESEGSSLTNSFELGRLSAPRLILIGLSACAPKRHGSRSHWHQAS